MKSKQIRELQVSSSRLAFIFLALLGVTVIIFLLGVSIGKKYGEAQLEASKEKTRALSETGILAEKASIEKKPEPILEGEKITPPEKKPVQMEKTEPEQMKLAESLPVKKAEKPEKSEPPPAKITPEAKLARPEARVYYVQIAAFSRKEASASIIQELKKAGYEPLILDPFPDDKKPLYRVRIGPFKSEAEAEAARNRVRTLIPEASRAYVVR